jgi:hypothetical protein
VGAIGGALSDIGISNDFMQQVVSGPRPRIEIEEAERLAAATATRISARLALAASPDSR